MNHRPRLLVVSHPAVLRVNQLVYSDLQSRDWDVELVVPHRWRHDYSLDDITPEFLPGFASSVHLLPVVLPGRPQRHFYRVNPVRFIRGIAPDVVFCEQEPVALSALEWGYAAHHEGIPFGVQIDENLDRPIPMPIRWNRSWVLRHAEFVAARSPTAARLAGKWGATGLVDLIPHHIPNWSMAAHAEAESFRIGFVGRLVREKGLDVLVDAIRNMKGSLELVIAGNGPLRGWLEEQDLGDSRLRFLASVPHDEMASAYAAMDVLVLPSRTTPKWAEQFGRALVEALWCGVPVVGSDSGEIRWVVETTGGGLVFAEGDSIGLVAILEVLRGDRSMRERLATEGSRRVRELFSVDAVSTRLSALLQNALTRQ